jgi:hypothetical protein
VTGNSAIVPIFPRLGRWRSEQLGESRSQASVTAQIPGYRGALVVERQQVAESLAEPQGAAR